MLSLALYHEVQGVELIQADRERLLEDLVRHCMELDRAAYFVVKNNNIIEQLEKAKNLKVLQDYGGYKIYKRELK